MRRAHRPLVVVVAVSSLLAAACSNRPEPLEIGLRRVALDLAFKDATKAADVSPRAVATQLDLAVPALLAEVPEEIEPPRRGPRVVVIPARKQEPVCGVAPPGAGYDVPTYPLVKDPPVTGVYTRHYTGTVKLQTTVFDLEFPYPPKAKVEVSDVKDVNASTYITEQDAKALPAEVRGNTTVFLPKVEYKLTRHGPSGLKQVDTFQYTKGGATGGDFLLLVRRETTIEKVTTVFTPTPPIRYIRLFVAEGTDEAAVTHSGIDRETQTALAVQSDIISRESVDVCGEVVDTFRVQIQENFVDLSKSPPTVSGNENGTFNYWNIQFDKGLLIIREEVHSTYRGTTQVAGAPVPVTVLFDYVGTLDSLTPEPPKPASTAGEPAPRDDAVEEEEG